MAAIDSRACSIVASPEPAAVAVSSAIFATRWAPLTGVKDGVYAMTRMRGLRWLWDAVAGTGLRSLYRGINTVPSSAVIPPPQEHTLSHLRQQFEPEIRSLESMIGRSLATWRK